jgi:hypothetical protein
MADLSLARRKSVPLVALETADQAGLPARVRAAVETVGSPAPVVMWDAVRGLKASNDEGAAVLAQCSGDPSAAAALDTLAAETVGSLASALSRLAVSAAPWVVVALGADRQLSGSDAAMCAAAVVAHRERGKALRQMVVLAGSAPWRLDPDLRADVLVLSEPLPDDKAREAIIGRMLSEAGYSVEQVPQAVEATRGLSAFAVEQAAALSTIKETKSLDVAALWARSRSAISQVEGLTMADPETLPKLGDISGNGAVCEFYRRLFAGPEAPSALVLVDEIEKTGLAASEHETSGTSRAQVGALLSAMETHKWVGGLLVGQPGSGKTMLAEAVAGEFGRPLLKVDLGQAKGGIVGQSEHQMAALLETVWAVAGPGAYWMGSSNTTQGLPAALLRRFVDGLWYFDLLSKAERESCWDHYCAQWGHDSKQQRPIDHDWTGAEIRNCCRLAYRLGCSLVEAGEQIIPIAQADPRTLEALRHEADGHYRDAARGGVYRKDAERRAAVVRALES